MLQLKNIRLAYGTAPPILDNFSMDFAEGSFTSVLGASGCGKSSLLRIIAGLQKPLAGRITHGLKKSDIGFVFQDPTLMAWARVYDNVALPLTLRGAPKAEIKNSVHAALDMVGLKPYENFYPHQLSGGMKMRVSVARALVSRPKLLLLDEPFAALDEIARMALEDDLLRIWRQTGCTIIFVTHHVAASVYLADNMLIMGAHARMEKITLNKPDQQSEPQSRHAPALQSLCAEISQILLAASQGKQP